MEKIKSILSPGKQTDDQIMYGSTDSPDGLKGGRGAEGSHFKHVDNTRQNQSETTQQSRPSEPYVQSNTTSTTQQPMFSQDPSTTQRNDYRQDRSNQSQEYNQNQTVDQSQGYNQNQTTDQSRRMDDRQHMPGRYPTGDSLKDQGVHNPYTSHDIDPRVGGSTGQSSTQVYPDNRNQQTSAYNDKDRSYQTNPAQSQAQTQGERLKGLNAARTEDYSQDGPSAATDSEQYGRNKAAGGGAIGAAGAGMTMKHHHDQDSPRSPGTTTRSNEYSGTTSSGNNNNYYGAPSGTAVSGSQQNSLYTTGGPGYDTTQTSQPYPYDSSDRAQQGGYTNEQYPTGTQRGQQTYADDHHDNQESHKLRNTAIGAGAAGLGAHEYREHKHGKHDEPHDEGYNNYAGNNSNRYDQNTTTGKYGADTTRNTDGQDRFYGKQNELGHHGGVAEAKIAGTDAETSQPYPYDSSNRAQQGGYTNEQYPTGTQRGQQTYADDHHDNQESHKLRNTAIGAGAAGLGAHEYREHKHGKHDEPHDEGYNNNRYDQNTTTGKYGADTSRNTDGQDRFYGKQNELGHHGGVAETKIAGTDAETSQPYPYDSSNRAQQGGYTNEQYPTGTQRGQQTYADDHYDNQESHKLRNTAIGAGAAGLGAHEYREHKHGKHDEPHDEGYNNYAGNNNNRYDQNNPRNTDGQDNFHGNRQAVAGAGMPLGDHEGTKRYTEHSHGLDNPAYNKNKIDHAPISGQPIPGDGIELPRGNQYNQQPNDPRYGLPLHKAGVTAGEAETLRAHDDDLMAKHESKASKHHGKGPEYDTTTHEKKPRRKSLLGFLHRDKNKKYSKEEEDEFARQEREHNSRSSLTNAGIASAGAAGAGAAGFHHDNSSGLETNKPLPHPPNQQIQSGYTGDGQEMNLTDRTRPQDTTSGPGYTGGMVDRQGDQIDERSGYEKRNESPAGQYAAGNTDRTNNRDDTLGSTYPGDGRDYPVGQSSTSTGAQGYNDNSADGMSSKVLERDNGHKVLHKKGHLIHPGQDAETAARQ